jgi:3-deoxy-D-manno-octulosonate 8-phosphate phosphatase KdsC-like HAD superfamily phosphatase
MANTTSVKPAEVREVAKSLGITDGFGLRGRLSAQVYAQVLAAEPKMLRKVAGDLGINLSEFRGNARKELIVSISETLV